MFANTMQHGLRDIERSLTHKCNWYYDLHTSIALLVKDNCIFNTSKRKLCKYNWNCNSLPTSGVLVTDN